MRWFPLYILACSTRVGDVGLIRHSRACGPIPHAKPATGVCGAAVGTAERVPSLSVLAAGRGRLLGMGTALRGRPGADMERSVAC
jgi:hypothetical protein